MQCAASLGWLLSFSDLHLRFLHVFPWLMAHFFLVLINISFSGWTTMYLSTHLLKDIWVAPKFWQL